MSITKRLADADLLWEHGRREGALLCTLVAVAGIARRLHPRPVGDGEAFRRFLRDQHDWTISVEYRGSQVDLDQLFYTWMRCELVHTGALPTDLRIDDHFADPASLTVRAGGAPHHTILLTPGWFHFLTDSVQRSLGRK